ncbi:Protein transport protein SEC31 [Symbiodinium microadriaticum]|uniref:Protein transport protein SEC31 n=1 Tax=Symbiodinium microadriaticum TaxID=2951 RepID=A0A1Q9C334_SYMMI|nr:Protein transport protein SEC31 [Symbiodinium microadriaticum]
MLLLPASLRLTHELLDDSVPLSCDLAQKKQRALFLSMAVRKKQRALFLSMAVRLVLLREGQGGARERQLREEVFLVQLLWVDITWQQHQQSGLLAERHVAQLLFPRSECESQAHSAAQSEEEFHYKDLTPPKEGEGDQSNLEAAEAVPWGQRRRIWVALAQVHRSDIGTRNIASMVMALRLPVKLEGWHRWHGSPWSELSCKASFHAAPAAAAEAEEAELVHQQEQLYREGDKVVVAFLLVLPEADDGGDGDDYADEYCAPQVVEAFEDASRNFPLGAAVLSAPMDLANAFIDPSGLLQRWGALSKTGAEMDAPMLPCLAKRQLTVSAGRHGTLARFIGANMLRGVRPRRGPPLLAGPDEPAIWRPLKQIQRTATVAWCPTEAAPSLLALGSSAHSAASAIGGASGSDATLEFVSFDAGRSGHDMEQRATIRTEGGRRFTKLSWGKLGLDASPGLFLTAESVVSLWNPQTILNSNGTDPGLVHTQSVHKGDVHCVEFHPLKPNLLATCGSDSEVKIVNFDNPAAPSIFEPSTTNKHQGSEVLCCAWNRIVPHILCSCSNTGTTVVWDLKQKKEVISFQETGGGWGP